jgi:hypothetical protein
MVIYERLFMWKYFKILWLKEMIAISMVWNLIKTSISMVILNLKDLK